MDSLSALFPHLSMKWKKISLSFSKARWWAYYGIFILVSGKEKTPRKGWEDGWSCSSTLCHSIVITVMKLIVTTSTHTKNSNAYMGFPASLGFALATRKIYGFWWLSLPHLCTIVELKFLKWLIHLWFVGIFSLLYFRLVAELLTCIFPFWHWRSFFLVMLGTQ